VTELSASRTPFAPLVFALALGACAPSNGAARPEIAALALEPIREPTAHACSAGVFPAVLSESSDHELRRVFLPGRLGERDVLFLLDTGSASSFLYDALDARDRRDAEAVRVGCHEISLRHRRNRGQRPHGGVDVVGTIGTDLLRNGVFELDLRHGALAMLARKELPNDVSWNRVTLEIVRGIALARVTVDGRPRRMMIDTGTAHLLMLDPSAVEEGAASTTDSAGRTILLVPAKDTIGFEGMPEVEARSWHTRRHPSFQKHIASLGGDIEGIVGLSTLGRRRVVFDFEQHAMYLERSPAP
jgi:hypothetical protein